MLTSKQKELLLLIHERLQTSGVPPSFDEMKDALELKSKSGIHRLITALEERGFIRRLPHRARALEVIRLPDHMSADAAPPLASGLLTVLRREPLRRRPPPSQAQRRQRASHRYGPGRSRSPTRHAPAGLRLATPRR